MRIPFLEYQSALTYNRQVLLMEHSGLLKTFIAIDGDFDTLIELSGTRRDYQWKSHARKGGQSDYFNVFT